MKIKKKILDYLPTSKKNNEDPFRSGIFNLNDISIYTHNYQCIARAYPKIFNQNIYDFKAETETPNIIDCGANIGLAAIYWKQIYPKATITCFEPEKKAFNSLKKNISNLNLNDVKCINKALADKVETLNFSTNEIISGSIRKEKKLDIAFKVETALLSDYIKTPVDLLKIDIEGAEKYVLPEIESKLTLVKNLFLEYHSFVSEKQYLGDILKLLESNGFRYYMEDEYKSQHPFVKRKVSLEQDLQLNIWAYRE